jgi:protein tyrosine/serine phosphatase
MSWVEWVISNKNYRKKPQRKEAIVYLIETLTDIAKKNGSAFAYTVIKNKSLSAIYEQVGYIDGDTNIKEMIKSL